MIMKKLFTTLVLAFALFSTMSAQEQAIGLRLGGGTSYDGEISYQKMLSGSNRLELDLGFINNAAHGSGVALTGIYQWTWELNDLTEGFGWFAGVGGGLRIFDGFGLGLNGQIGIEYKIPDVPLQLTLDTRPGWYFGNANGFFPGAALGVRYTF